tara:strand:- start:1297 stop:1569 length:273 start_codon:yes stop_codon:yes gene_type:complete
MKCRKCLQKVRQKKIPCKSQECRHWVDYADDLNCVFESIEKSTDQGMTLREVAKRLGISFVRVKQIEDAALKKICINNPQLFEYLLKDDF